MRTLLCTSLLLVLTAPSFADEANEPPRCTIIKIRRASEPESRANATSIDVPGVYAKGPRWAEYNCRQDSRALATSWVTEHGGCAAGDTAIKYSVALGEKGREKTSELTIACPKAGSTTAPASTSVPSAVASEYRQGDKLDVEWKGAFYPATILRVVGAHQYLIHYDGFSSKWDETVGASRIRSGSTTPPTTSMSTPATPAATDTDKDPFRCMLVKVKERHLGERDVSPAVEVDWLKGQKYPDKIPAKSQEILCQAQAMTPAIEWAKANGLCGPDIKYTVNLGRLSNPKALEGGAICNSRKPLGH